MASWSDLLLPLFVAAVLLYLPGGLITAAARLPVRVAVAVAPPLSVAIIAGTGIIAPMVGLAWGPGPVAGVSVIAVLAALAVHHASTLLASRRGGDIPAAGPGARASSEPGKAASDEPAAPADGPSARSKAAAKESAAPAPSPGRMGAWTARCRSAASDLLGDLGLWVLSAALMTMVCVRLIKAPDAFSQTYDAVFHLNAVRWILDTGNASTLSFDMVVSNGAIYPLAWHTLVALTMRISGTTSIPLATNAVMFAVAGLVWTSGIIALTSALTAGRRAGRIASAVLASAAPAFPLLVLSWGILYPVFLATAVLPGILLTAVAAVDPRMPLSRRAVPWLMAAGGCAGMVLAHPSLLVVAILAAVIAAAARTVSMTVSARTRHDALRAVRTCVLTVVLAAGSWFLAAPSLRASRGVSYWAPHTSVSGGIGEAVTSAPNTTAIVWLLAFLVAVGFFAAWRRPSLWWVAALHAVLCGLYVMNVSQPFSELRYNLIGFWYSDPNRLISLMMVTALPLAGVGTCALADAIIPALPRAAHAVRTVTGIRATLTVVAIVVLAWQGPCSAAMSHNIKSLGQTFRLTDKSLLLTTDELAVVNQLPDLLGPDDVVLADPWRGGSLAYALTGVNTLPRHMTSYSATSPALQVLEDSLDEVRLNPEICPAIKELGVDYVLDFKGRAILNHPMEPGLSGIRPGNGFEPVLKIGNATLYRITACA